MNQLRLIIGRNSRSSRLLQRRVQHTGFAAVPVWVLWTIRSPGASQAKNRASRFFFLNSEPPCTKAGAARWRQQAPEADNAPLPIGLNRQPSAARAHALLSLCRRRPVCLIELHYREWTMTNCAAKYKLVFQGWSMDGILYISTQTALFGERMRDEG